MNGLITTDIQCPCCWETFEVVIDTSVDEQNYVEDCYVCCRPLVIDVKTDGEALTGLQVRSENE